MIKGKPPRLSLVYPNQPLYFVTSCTLYRRPTLAKEPIHDAFRDYCRRGCDYGVGVGRYVLMPDHVHMFVRGGIDFDLGVWVRGLKRAISRERNFWQPGFSTTFFGAMKVTVKNGITFGRIPYARVWLQRLMNGPFKVRLW